MADSATIDLRLREPEGSRATRRLRREGFVPGVIYGGEVEPATFAVDAKVLRNALAAAGAVLEVNIDGGKKDNVVVKDLQRHPVRGEVVHIDLLRVRMDVAIHATVALELTGGDESPGVKEGGVLTQELRELTIEALPGDIPDVITHDVSGLAMAETVRVSDLKAPAGVTILDDPEHDVGSITLPTAEPVEEELEVETELVGEEGEVAEGQAEGDTGEEARAPAEGASSSDES